MSRPFASSARQIDAGISRSHIGSATCRLNACVLDATSFFVDSFLFFKFSQPGKPLKISFGKTMIGLLARPGKPLIFMNQEMLGC